MTEERTAYRADKGGKRPGAGRPKGIGNDGPSKKMISVRLDPRIIKWLKSHPALSVSSLGSCFLKLSN
jgi:hypothetical protein